MRIGGKALVRRWNADLHQRRPRAFERYALRHVLVREDRLDHLRRHRQDWIQRHHRILEDHRDPVAPKLSQRLGGELPQVAAVEQDRAVDDPSRRIDQAHDRIAGHRFAGARLADEPHHFALAHDERYVVDRLHHAGPREEMRAQAGDLEERRGWFPPERRCAPFPPRGASALGRPGGAHGFHPTRAALMRGVRTGPPETGSSARPSGNR